MFDGESILCFAHDWDGDPTSKTHIMRILSKRNRVLWVNSIGMRRATATRSDLHRMAAKLRKCFGGCREVEPNLFVVDPLAIPLPGVSIADRLNAAALAVRLRRHLRRLDMKNPILWSFLPNVDRLVGRLGERMVIYHCVDEYTGFAGVPKEATRRMEERIVAKADLVLTSSQTLADERARINPNTHFISHGVDLAHFGRALDPHTRVPEEMKSLRRPVIGFIGLIADWVDVQIIRAIADARPSWSIALIGKTATDTRPLEGAGNIHFLGRKPYADLPDYCRGIDVGIVPFRVNRLTVRANPLKMREYLAAGLPVVATPLPEIAKYDGLLRLANDGDQFVAGIEAALEERSPVAARARARAMESEGWEARVSAIAALIDRSRVAA